MYSSVKNTWVCRNGLEICVTARNVLQVDVTGIVVNNFKVSLPWMRMGGKQNVQTNRQVASEAFDNFIMDAVP